MRVAAPVEDFAPAAVERQNLFIELIGSKMLNRARHQALSARRCIKLRSGDASGRPRPAIFVSAPEARRPIRHGGPFGISGYRTPVPTGSDLATNEHVDINRLSARA